MRYTRTALGLLNAQYRSVLKKCFLINMGLFACGAAASAADAAVTLSPTLDGLKTEAQKTGAVSSEVYTLTKLNDGGIVPEGKATVRIGGSVYYFSPKAGENAKLLSILAGTPVASVDNAANPNEIKFDVANISTKFPSSVFKYDEKGTENDHNFVVQEANQDGNITKKYYKIFLKTDNMHTSPNISWEKVGADKKDESRVIAVKLPNGQTEYYKYNNQPSGKRVYSTRQNDLSGDINADFINSSVDSTSAIAQGGVIYNGGAIGNITGDFIGNHASNSYSSSSNNPFAAQGGAVYNNGTIGNIIGDFIGNYASNTYVDTYNFSDAAGGAIYNDEYRTIGGIIGDFIGNYASVSSSYSSYAAAGGAIYNKGKIGNITGNFISNYVSSSYDDATGGAIYNEGGTIGDITGDFIGNYASAAGGAIYNKGKIGNITGDFIGNYASSSSDANGGAIYNEGGTIGDITGDFIGNYSSATGGAIYNKEKIGNITGDFIGNYASAAGGAIYNSYKGTICNISGDFIGNYVSSSYEATGGAIYNDEYRTIGDISGDFIGNYAYSSYAYGGAIYNNQYGTIRDITGDFIGNYVSSVSSHYDAKGGAICNDEYGTISNIDGNFNGNYVSTSSYYAAKGGAIYNDGIIENITGDFIGNHASSSSSDAKGGAIYNDEVIENITGNFVDNHISSSYSYAYGGAIYNSYSGGGTKYKEINIAGNFIGNYASSYSSYASSSYVYGGAIYNENSIITISGASTFTDNYVEFNDNKKSNAIFNKASYSDTTINFNSGNIVINDAIIGENSDSNTSIKSIFNFAGQTTATSDNDVITLNNSITNNDITQGNIDVNLSKGTLKLGHYYSALLNDTFYGTFGNGVNLTISGDSTLTLIDDDTHSVSLGNLTLNSDVNLGMDVDLFDNSSDTFTTDALTSNDYNIILKQANVIKDTDKHITEVTVNNHGGVLKIDDNLIVTNGANLKNTYLAEVTDANTIKFGNIKALETAVQFKKADKNFEMSEDAVIETDLGALKNDGLNIMGNNYTIDGAGLGGMTIANGQTVSLNDVTVKGFNGAFAENNGTLNIAASEGNKVNLNSGINGSGEINADGKGKLNINSDISANKMTVLGGELNLKNGTELSNVENFIANGGVLNVGGQNVNLKKAEFNDGSTLAVNVKSDGNGLLKAENLTINGGSLKATLGQGIVEKGSKTVTLLESSTEFTNNFTDVVDNNMYRFEKADKAGDYIIRLAKTAEEVSQENGGTQNNANAAKGWVDGSKFEQGSVSADVADKLADLAQNNGKKFNEALSAIAPNDSSMVRVNAVNNNIQMFRAVVSHLDDVSKKKQYGLSSGDAVDGVSVWAKAFGNHVKVDDMSKAYGFKTDGYGATLGIEKQLNDAFKVGLGYSYFYNDVDGFMRDSDVNTHTGFVYGEYRPNNWYTNAIASYGYSKYDENKHVAGDVYKAKYDVDNIGMQVMTGYNANVAKFDITPEAGLRYNNIHRDNYTDSAGQAVKAETMEVMTAVAGLKVGKDLVSCFGLHEVYWRPEARLAATYDLISDKENAVVSLSNGSGYVVNGQRLNRLGIETGAGVTVFLTPEVESSVGYEGKFRKDYQDHTGYVGAKYKF